jgi:hypothetical protein
LAALSAYKFTTQRTKGMTSSKQNMCNAYTGNLTELEHNLWHLLVKKHVIFIGPKLLLVNTVSLEKRQIHFVT